MSTSWTNHIRDASEVAWLGPTIGTKGLPAVAQPIDVNMRQIVKAINVAKAKTQFDGLYVEDLLATCIDRLRLCLDVRDKAQELSLRATSTAVDLALNKTILDASANYDAAFFSLAPTLNQNGAGYASQTAQQVQQWVPLSSGVKLWQDMSTARGVQVNASRNTIEAKLQALKEPGNPSNFAERFEFLQVLFQLHLQEAYARALVCRDGLSEIYGIDLDPPARDSLNDLVIWAQNASDLLDREIDGRAVVEMSLAISAADANTTPFALCPRATFTAQVAANRLSFTVTEAPFTTLGLVSPRLRSFKIQVRPTAPATFSRVWPMRIVLPQVGSGLGGQGSVAALGFDQFRDFDTGQAVVRGVHNRNPIGAWDIYLQPKSTDGTVLDGNSFSNLFMFLRVSCRRP